jgi:hypothetical protein
VASQTTGDKLIRELRLAAVGLRSLFVPSSPIEELAEDDHRLEVSTNEQLRKGDTNAHTKHLERSREAVAARLRLLRHALLLSAAIIGSALLGAMIFARVAPAVVVLHRRFFAIVSLGSFALGTLARLGWAGLSWHGGTVIERLDFYVLRTLYWLGTFSGALVLL